jgi:SPP1 family predicted phage head-tail adaptor
MWVISGTLWARIMPVKTHDSVVGLQSGHTITHTLHIRFHKAIKAGQRLSTDNHIYTIEHAEPTDDKRTFLKLLCVEKSF